MLHFMAEFTEEKNNGNKWLASSRTAYNEPGITKTDLYLAYPQNAEVIIGRDPEYEAVNKDLYYRVLTDGTERAKGCFGAWILGRETVDIDITGCRELYLCVRVENVEFEPFIINPSEKTVFWGNPEIGLADGSWIPLSELSYVCENTDCGNGVGTDYYGGPVKLQAKRYDKAIPAEPEDRTKEGAIRLCLDGLDAVRFRSDIGGDYPLGEEDGRRKTVAFRKTGKEASFITILEPYEKNAQIEGVSAQAEGCVEVRLKDGRLQRIEVGSLNAGTPDVRIREYLGDSLLREESC